MTSVFGSVSKLLGGNKAPKQSSASSAWVTTPVAAVDEDGVYYGYNGDAYVYRSLELFPLEWEDRSTRLRLGQDLQALLVELEEVSRGGLEGALMIKSLAASRYREVHVVSVTWEAPASVPPGTPEPLAEFQRLATAGYTFPARMLVVGVKLRSKILTSSKSNIVEGLKDSLSRTLGENLPYAEQYEEDYTLVEGLFRRYGGKKLTPVQDAQLRSWYSGGVTTDSSMYQTPDHLIIDNFDKVEMAAVMSFDRPNLGSTLDSQWLADALNHPEGPHVISIRARLEPASLTRNRIRTVRRKLRGAKEEEAATGDLDRQELEDAAQLAEEFEQYIQVAGVPILTNCSIVLGRRVSSAADSYRDYLRSRYDIQCKPLEFRQHDALCETLPCSPVRVNPFLQDITVGMLAYAGIHSFAALGDRKGILLGMTQTDLTPVYLDPLAAPEADETPAMLIAGVPGSGKTWTCQSIALQATLMGYQTIFINPKVDGSLAPLCDVAPNSQRISLDELTAASGVLDPFRVFPQTSSGRSSAADYLGGYILSVIEDLTEVQQIALQEGLSNGADAGARYAAEALAYVQDASVRDIILAQARGSKLFAVAIGMEPRDPFTTAKGLTLIEITRKLDMPNPQSPRGNRNQNINLAFMRLLTRSALEILLASGGGVLIVDEAWTFLSDPTGLAAINQLGREGRSANLLPIFATQRLADVVGEGRDLESYISRYLILRLTDPVEVKAAQRLLRLEDDPEAKRAFLEQAGPKRATEESDERPALALLRDLKGRHAAIYLGPYPEYFREVASTNPADRVKREANRLAAKGIVDDPSLELEL